MKKFPDGFLWGASTSAHQVEGDQKNNWSEWEPAVAKQLAEDAYARLASDVPDWKRIQLEAEDPQNYISGAAAEHFHRHEEDAEILKGLGLNAYRFSVEWSRIEPTQGRFNEEAIEHYKQRLQCLQDNNITPIVVLHHFTNPVWFDELGSWHNPKSVALFTRYAKRIIAELETQCEIFLTFNETNAYLLSRYMGGGIWADWPEAEFHPWRMKKAIQNLAQSHRQIYKDVKMMYPHLQIGTEHGMVVFKAERRDPLTILFRRASEYASNELFAKKVAGYEDVLCIHYYVRMNVKATFGGPRQWVTHHDSAIKTDMGWGVYPRGIYEVTQKLRSKNLPIYITENGLADARDVHRAEFILKHLGWLHESIEDGADIRGYFHWSLFDNFEWSEGYWPKFGLIAVNRTNQERTIRDSAKLYGRIAKANGLDADLQG